MRDMIERLNLVQRSQIRGCYMLSEECFFGKNLILLNIHSFKKSKRKLMKSVLPILLAMHNKRKQIITAKSWQLFL